MVGLWALLGSRPWYTTVAELLSAGLMMVPVLFHKDDKAFLSSLMMWLLERDGWGHSLRSAYSPFPLILYMFLRLVPC